MNKIADASASSDDCTSAMVPVNRVGTPDLNNDEDVQSGIAHGMQRLMDQQTVTQTTPTPKRAKPTFSLSQAIGSKGSHKKAQTQPSTSPATDMNTR